MKYPIVHGEYETLAKIKEGYSLARYGDGEIGVMCGSGYCREPQNSALSKELRYIMDTPSECLIGIPTMDEKGSRYWNWKRHLDRYTKLIPHNREYYSSFISRPDCGDWMLTREYAEAVQSIWLGKKVCFIGSEPGRNKLAKAIEMTQEIVFIEAPFREAYSQIDSLENSALKSGCDMVIISAGVTATCLAYRLAPKIQAVDLGSIGGFMVKMLGLEKWNND